MANSTDEKERKIKARERLIEMDIDRFHGITLDLFKWLTAATLSINGAPLLGMLGSDSLRPMLSGPGIVFAFGLAFSIFGNLLLVKGLAQAGEALFIEHWAGRGVSKDNYDEVAADADMNRWSFGGSVLLGLSIVVFLLGIIWMGMSLEAK